MNTAEIIYEGQLRTQATHLASGDVIRTDAPLDNRGKGASFSPTDLVAAALGTCMLTIMGIRARDKGWSIEGTRVVVTKEMLSSPRRIGAISLSIHVPQDFDEEARTLLIHAAKSCPVACSLHPEIQQHFHFSWGAT